MDLYALASEYVSTKEHAEQLKYQISYMNKTSELTNDIENMGEAEQYVFCIMRGWKRQLLKMELFMCKYEMAVSLLSERERLVLRLHYEQRLSLRQIAASNFEEYGLEQLSLSTLSRCAKNVERKFEQQYEGNVLKNMMSIRWLEEP